ncbi:DUF5615 family PIN-like protein [Microcoleus sp. B4-D4]|uniref:DUF5615 family PIN-like protein n=1 Tax=Microcoleus sp. B4-D4 TaxID=2818667 RepID=UPI002FCE949A
MAPLYADEQSRNANLGIPDEDVLAFAVTKERAVLTLNRIDFIRLHASQPNHSGIIVCKDDQQDRQRMAARISEAIANVETQARNAGSSQSSISINIIGFKSS